MPKKPMNTSLPNEESTEISPSQVTSLADKVIFEPTSPQAKVKARFWTRFRPGPLTGSRITMAHALELTGSAALRKWWSQPGFVEWFSNKDEERERLKYLFHKGLDTIENILDNPDANANAKANLIKMLAEMNGYLGKKPVEKFADESINKMSEAELQEFLQRKLEGAGLAGLKLVQERVVDVSGSAENNGSEAGEEDPEASEGRVAEGAPPQD